MPYADRDQQLDYLRNYSPRYAAENAEAIKERRAKWFQDRKATATVLQRVKRALARCEPGLAKLRGEEKAKARAAITALATSPDLDEAAVVGLWHGVSRSGRSRFLNGLESARERAKWEKVLA